MMKLGLRGPKADRFGRTLKLADYISPSFAVPASTDLMFGLAPDTDPLGNDAVGCCAVAGPGHFARWEDRLLGGPDTVGAAGVLREYSELSGYVPGDASTDTGLYAIDVMKRWRSTGLFGRQIDAFALVDHYDWIQLEAATFLLGGAFLCLALPKLAKDGPITEVDVWDVARDDGGAAGGHLVWRQGDTVASWGKRILVTPAFVARYCWEAWAVVSRHGLRDGRAFSGLDLAGLMRAVEAVTA